MRAQVKKTIEQIVFLYAVHVDKYNIYFYARVAVSQPLFDK
jgi:hypothetical protein